MNPAEELVTVWLQECRGYFTMNNVIVEKKDKGGKKPEIDILAIKLNDGKDNKKELGKRVWVEVDVSISPWSLTLNEAVKIHSKDFSSIYKAKKAKSILRRAYEKWLILGKTALSKENEDKFVKRMQQRHIEVKWFTDILSDLLSIPKYYREDVPRAYINLFKTFWPKK